HVTGQLSGRSRRAHVLRARLPSRLSESGDLCRQDIERRQACGLAGRAADEIRAGDQPQDREGARPRNPAPAACACRPGDRMRRREVLTLVGGAAAWPLAARAQQPARLPTVGYMGSATPATQGQWAAVFAQRLQELGWTEGRNVKIEVRWAEGRSERFAEIAAEFIALKVDVMVTSGGVVPTVK